MLTLDKVVMWHPTSCECIASHKAGFYDYSAKSAYDWLTLATKVKNSPTLKQLNKGKNVDS
jgi:hypothetical protein